MFCHYMIVLFVTAVSVRTTTCQSVIIKNLQSGLVLDATVHEIQLQQLTGSLRQLWTLEHAGLGKFIIINRGSGKAMDINGGIIPEARIITSQRHGAVNQQWFINSDNTIVSGSGNLAVDVLAGNFVPGAAIIAHAKHGATNQLFSMEYL